MIANLDATLFHLTCREMRKRGYSPAVDPVRFSVNQDATVLVFVRHGVAEPVFLSFSGLEMAQNSGKPDDLKSLVSERCSKY